MFHSVTPLHTQPQDFSNTFPGPSRSPRRSSIILDHTSQEPVTHHSSCPTSPNIPLTSSFNIPSRSVSTDTLSDSQLQSSSTGPGKTPLLTRTDSHLSMYTIFEEEKSTSQDSLPPKKTHRLSFRRKHGSPKKPISRQEAVPVAGESGVVELFNRIGDVSANQLQKSAGTTPQLLESQLLRPLDAEAVSDTLDSKEENPSCKPKLRKVGFVREDTPVVLHVSSHEESKEKIETPPAATDVQDRDPTPKPPLTHSQASMSQPLGSPLPPTPADDSKVFYENQRPESEPTFSQNPSPSQEMDLLSVPKSYRRSSSPLLGRCSVTVGESSKPLHISALLSPLHPQKPVKSATLDRPVQLQRPKSLNIFPGTRLPLNQSNR